MKIGIFDTGTGGKLVAKRLKKLLPQHSYITAIDREHAPYGNRSPEEIITLTDAAIQPLLSCDIIVLACNTATTNAIGSLRQRYTDVCFMGFEPMIKSAVILTKSHHITMLATNATKHSQRLRALISEYATGLGCTHYLALKRRLQRLFPQCRILEPTAIIAKRISDFAS